MSLPQTRIFYTVEEYLAMERASEVRHEYLDGEIYEMSGESFAHGYICTNLVVSLATQLRGTPCSTFSKDMKVRSGALPSPCRLMKGLFSYPDVVIVCGRPQTHDEYQNIILNPNVIVEALSDSTEKFDRVEKFRRHRAHLATLTDYLLVAQDKPLIDHYHKLDERRWEWITVEGVESELLIAAINCTLRLAEVYDRVEFPPGPDELDSEE